MNFSRAQNLTTTGGVVVHYLKCEWEELKEVVATFKSKLIRPLDSDAILIESIWPLD